MSEQNDVLIAQKTIEETLKNVRASYASRLDQEIKQRKRLFVIACLFLVIAVAAIGLLYFLLPLKQTQPVLAIVDGAHGIVQEVQYLEPGSKITNNEALIKSYAYSYVTGRYGYAFVGSADNLRERYSKVMAFTGDNMQKNMKDEIASSNPNSPYSLYGEKGTVNVQIDSINVFSGDRVQVNFRTIANTGDGNNKVFSYTALGKFEWSQFENMSVKNRYLNPFGFRFTEWTVTQNSSNAALNVQPTTNNTATVDAMPMDQTQTVPMPADPQMQAPKSQPVTPNQPQGQKR